MNDLSKNRVPLSFLEACASRRRFIYGTTFAAFAISAAAVCILPNTYTATALLLPPSQSSGLMGAVLGQMGSGMANLAGNFLDSSNATETYVGMLKSRRIKDAVIDKHHLQDVYDEQYRLKLYKKIDENVDIWVGKREGIINIDVTDKDPKRAAEMANTYVSEINRLSADMAAGTSGQDTVFYAAQMEKAKTAMEALQGKLKKFQSDNKVLDLPDHAKASMAAILDLKAQLMLQQARLESLRKQFTDDTPEVKAVLGTVNSITGRISQMESGSGSGVLPSVSKASSVGQEYLNLQREFKIQETLYDLVRKQLELTKIANPKSSTSVQVIQTAVPPDYKSGPKRALIVVCVAFGAFFLSLLSVFGVSRFEALPDERREHCKLFLRKILFLR